MDSVNGDPFKLRLAAFPATVTAGDRAHALPLGARADVVARIKELLPGATFDDKGRGSFERATYRIIFELSGDEPTGIDVTIDRAEGFAALHRLATKTGWQAVDRWNNEFVDLDGSRVAGGIVAATADRAAQADEEAPSGRRRIGRAAAGMALAVALWVGWEWSRRVPGIPTPGAIAPSAAADAGAASSTSITPGPSAGGAATASDRKRARAVVEEIKANAERIRMRMKYIKVLAPRFRGDPVVYQMLDYQMAASTFPNSLGEHGFLSPEQLSDRTLFEGLGSEPKLPLSFAQPQRDGYTFEFAGSACDRKPKYLYEFIDRMCESFVYSALPIDQARPSYALYSTDFRIHYRTDGAMPEESDPTVDNTEASTAVDLPGGTSKPPRSEAESKIWRATDALLKAVGLGGLSKVTREQHESFAIQDLRRVAAAENAFNVTMGEGRLYAAPDRLADPAVFRPLNMQSLLPGYFVQPQRQGYRFEFVGEKPQPARGAIAPLGQVYESFVYSATPVDPGPAGRRTFALYADGLVFAANEQRVPTRQDTPLGDR